ncbi:hypothetical protein HI914_06460 [Erysiphe necator]|nr:hypothetical protein HI914_06460 [Erysiphe necator]
MTEEKKVIKRFKPEEKQLLSSIIQNYFSCTPMPATILLLEHAITLQKYSAVTLIRKRNPTKNKNHHGCLSLEARINHDQAPIFFTIR